MLQQRAIDNLANHYSLKGKVYKRKLLNPRRLKGISAFIASYGITAYLPYIAVYTAGPTLPIFAACASGLYGMWTLAETRCVN